MNVTLQIILGLVGLASTVFIWWIKQDQDKKKVIEDEDKKIDAVSNADDTIVELDRLRHQPGTRGT